MATKEQELRVKIYIGLITGVAFTFVLHHGIQYYNSNSEIKDFSYADLQDNISRYPEDHEFMAGISSALSDQKIVGKEHKAIVDSMINKYGSYQFATMSENHSNAKIELLSKFKI